MTWTRGALASVLALLVLALPLVIAESVYRGFNLPRYVVVIVAATVAGGLLVDLALARSFPRIGRALPALLALEVGALALASLVRAPDLEIAVWGSFERQMGLVTYAALAVLAVGAAAAVHGSERRFVWILRAVALAGLLAFIRDANVEVLDAGGRGPKAGETIRRWMGAFGQPNYSANLLLIPLFVAIGLAAGARAAWARAGWGLVGLAVAVEIVMLETRGAWLAAAIGAAVFVALLFVGPVRLTGAARGVLLRVSGLGAGIVLAGVIVVLVVPSLRARANAFVERTLRLEAGTSGRYEGWRDSVAFFRDHGLLGVGAESFRDRFLDYKSEDLGRVLVDQQLRDLHSMPLHLLAQGGVLALAAYLGLAGLAARRLLRTLREAGLGAEARWAAAGLLAALVAHFAHNVTICHVIASSMFWHVALGLAVGAPIAAPPPVAAEKKQPGKRAPAKAGAGAPDPGPRPLHWLVRAGAATMPVALAIAGVVHASRLLRADAAILRCQKTGKTEEGRRAIELARKPEIGPYHHMLSETLERLIPVYGPIALSDAIEHAKLAIQFGGNKESYPLELGYLYEKKGLLEEALEQARASIAVDRHFWGSHRFAAIVLFKLGRVEEARAEAAHARRLAPFRKEAADLEQFVNAPGR